MTEYIASSAIVGRRPMISRMLAYSSPLSPSSDHGWSTSGVRAACSTVSRPATGCGAGACECVPGAVCSSVLVIASGLCCGLEGVLEDRGEEASAVEARAVALLHRVLGVRHESDDVATLVGDA